MKKQLLNLGVAFAATLLFAGSALAQWAPKTAEIKWTENVPVIDGTLDAMWAGVPAQDIDIPFNQGLESEEIVTMTDDAVPTWKAVWDDDNIYVLVEVPDDEYFPNTTNSWTYDKPEIYFDVNPTIVEDGTTTPGAMHANSGHHQIAPTRDDVLDANASARYAFAVETGATTSYFVEYSFTIDSLLIRDRASSWDPETQAMIGFDVTVIDRDETTGAPTVDAHKRINWSNNCVDTREDAGAVVGESWSTLDASGELTLGLESNEEVTLDNQAIYPNVATDVINIKVEASSIAIINSVGQVVKQVNNNVNVVNVAELPAGVYFVTIKSSKGTFSSKFLKN